MIERYLPRTQFDSYEDFKENYTVEVPEQFNFGFDIVDEWAQQEPEKLALLWCDDHGEEIRFTFDDIRRLSNQAANYFSALGIGKGSVVMLILRRRWEYWVCAVALHKLGAVLIPGSLQLTAKDIAYRAQSAHIQMVVCIDDDFVLEQVDLAMEQTDIIRHRLLIRSQRAEWRCFTKELPAYSQKFSRPTGEDTQQNEDTMLVYFTSGTTGMPKMVHHNFTYPLGHITTAKYWQQVQENKLHLSVSDSGWAKFGWGKIYGQWICGAAIMAYDMDKFVAKNLLHIIEKYQVATFCAPPTMYRFMLQEDVGQYDLSSVQHYGIAGEPLNPEVFRRWQDITGHRMYEGFGQSESSVIMGNFPWFAPLPGSMGKPSPLYQVELNNAEGKLCEDGEEGEVTIRAQDGKFPVGLFTGYYLNEEATKKVFINGVYHTGDLAYRDENGYFWFIGRNDDVIKCSGYRIGPFEVESALIEHPAVVECAITGAPDPIRGQVVKATVVLAKDYSPSEALKKELQEHVKHTTAPYKYPRIVDFVEDIPKTLGGKIKRAQIRKHDQHTAETK